ncbi:PKD domain-containing protein [Tamlana sp. 2_MG-2023]|uniref:PKD domain-containing protein n=1 Tax=unclassified Tamlana TaxID=2614803 RepID=UPI0026E19654|nr:MULTISPECIES: PKD domain-containing protein [unclassified Tamlana]MDO6760484.1 PKD domain-containing protein [Tamlana sp. 2_MG-2023]MDO6790740.1 PKD domain-containing protein [Tamlana sp. 1_MG-2023]
MKIYKLIKSQPKSSFALLVLFLGLVSCYDDGYEPYEPPTGNINGIEPNTQFTTSLDPDNTLSVVFRSYSTDAASYAWDFGDGNTSTDANPNYTYADGGLYDVKLTTVSSDGLTAVDSTQVGPVSVDFDFSVVDSEVTFNNMTSGAESLVWDFGDGTSVSWDSENQTEQDPEFSPVHIYSDVGPFYATLTVTNYVGDDYTVTEEIKDLVLSTVPDFTFVVNKLTVDFTDASLLATSHSWDFGDGNTSTDLNPTHTYANNGTYDVTLTTTNDAGVSKSKTQTVPVGGIQPTVAAVIANGSIDEFTAFKDDNNDAWETDPPNSLKDGTASPYTWENSGLKSLGKKAAGITSSSHTGDYGLKFDSDDRRAYQPFEVEVGVEYTISMFVKTESPDDFTIYMLNNEVQDETDLAGNSDEVFVVSGNTNTYTEYTFTFIPTTTTAVFYAVPFSGVDGSTEVYLDDISIETPGF